MTAMYKLLPYLLSVLPRSPRGLSNVYRSRQAFFDDKTFWAMLEVVSIKIERRHVVIFTISIVTSIKSVVYTCVSDGSVLVCDLSDLSKY
jgi:hypothetical protein